MVKHEYCQNIQTICGVSCNHTSSKNGPPICTNDDCCQPIDLADHHFANEGVKMLLTIGALTQSKANQPKSSSMHQSIEQVFTTLFQYSQRRARMVVTAGSIKMQEIPDFDQLVLKNTSNRSSKRAKHGLRRIAVFSISKQDA
jgi:hypothetical protein